MDEEIAQTVREYGWYSENFSDADPPFLYSIGLMETGSRPTLRAQASKQ